MNHKNNQNESGGLVGDEADSLKDVGTFKWGRLLKVFLIRIPLWLVILVFVALGAWSGYSKITAPDKPVNLRPAISEALSVNVVITTCNDKIDEAGYNIREEEKRLEGKFEDVEKVGQASVIINRDDKGCTASSNTGSSNK